MNWTAGLLVIIGALIVVIGFSNSQNVVCQALFGGTCSWLPGKEGLTPVGTGTQTPGLGTSKTQTTITGVNAGNMMVCLNKGQNCDPSFRGAWYA